MAKNYVQHGRILTLLATAAVTAGQGVLEGNIFGVAQCDASIGESYTVDTEGAHEMPCLSTDVIAVGDPLYWDDGNSRFTKTATGNWYVGSAIAASGSGTATVVVRLNGSFARAAEA